MTLIEIYKNNFKTIWLNWLYHIMNIFYKIQCRFNKHVFMKTPYIITYVSPINHFECIYCNQVAISYSSNPLSFVYLDVSSPLVYKKIILESTRHVLIEKMSFVTDVIYYVHA